MYEIGAPREGVEGKDDNIFFKDTNKASYMEMTVKLTGGVEKVGGGKFLESGMVKLVLCNLNEFGEVRGGGWGWGYNMMENTNNNNINI